MLIIMNNHTNPYFNLAAEEYLLNNFQEDCFMLWRNAPCIVVGKNQNTLSEINVHYVKEHHIPVVRRLSGGGAVFHDLGNLNFTFIMNEDGNSFNNFAKFTQPILAVLQNLGVNAQFTGRNDLTINDQKFSGNAQYKHKNRILHHGTLLFTSDITDLSAALKAKPAKFEGKGVKSISKRVTNISKHLKSPLSIIEFKELIMNYVMTTNRTDHLLEFTTEDMEKINQLVKEKYDTWKWNFGSSPNYTFKNEKRYPSGTLEFYLNVENGIIKNVKIFGDFFSQLDISAIENALTGAPHSETSIRNILSKFEIGKYFSHMTLDQLIEGIF